jgi:hypothetical protein
MTYRTRKRLALLALVIGLPLYAGLALWALSLFERPHPLLELALYALLGIVWALPLRAIFKGVARPDPDDIEPR